MSSAVVESGSGAGARPPAPPTPPGAWRGVGTSGAAKLVVMGVSALVSVVTVRWIIGDFGVAAYAQYGLLVSMASLLPLSDLGLGAAVLNAVGASPDPTSDEVVERTILSCLRIVLISAVAIAVGAVTISAIGAWPSLLGEGLIPTTGPRAALVCLLLFAVTQPLAMGPRVLTALGRNWLRIALSGLSSPLFAGCVGVLVLLGAPAGAYLGAFSYGVGVVVAGCGALVALRALGPLGRRVMRDLLRWRTVRGAPVLGVAWPMLVQTLAMPVAMQSDRLVLSHVSTPAALAEYTLASSLFGIPLQTITAAGLALWPVFARARAQSQRRSPAPMAGAFLAVGLAMATTLALLMPQIAGFTSKGNVQLGVWTLTGFVAFVGIQALNYPYGMYMTDPAGLRFQILPILAMVPVNLGLSLALAPRLGAGGPIVASAVAVGLCQVVPAVAYVHRDLRRARGH